MLIDQFERERARTGSKALSSHYRAIGPAAIIAALMFQPQRKISAKAA